MELTLQEIYSKPTHPDFRSFFTPRDPLVIDLQDLKKTFFSCLNFLKTELLHKIKAGKATNFFEDELFDSGTIARKYEADYLFLEKVEKYTLFSKHDGVIFPFNNTYEKMYFGMTLFDKCLFKFRQKVEFVPSDPFESGGRSHFFEQSELSRPHKCPYYLNLITQEVKRKFKVLEKSFIRFNTDIYDTYENDYVSMDNDAIRLGTLNRVLRKDNIYEKGIPTVEIEVSKVKK